ncbi:hypothetical protein [Thalassospira australica]|uniref:hypothetical protein n=1 Tax=Thalassospira australica TaxID=1528106 RepID=UPI0012E0BF37|nr:hypothetical protein [Thalassospira australica]
MKEIKFYRWVKNDAFARGRGDILPVGKYLLFGFVVAMRAVVTRWERWRFRRWLCRNATKARLA